MGIKGSWSRVKDVQAFRRNLMRIFPRKPEWCAHIKWGVFNQNQNTYEGWHLNVYEVARSMKRCPVCGAERPNFRKGKI